MRTTDTVRTDFTYQYPPFNTLDSRAVSALHAAVRPAHVYVHVPYCKSKCRYCYFKTWGIGEQTDVLDRYLELLTQEIDLYGRRPDVRSLRVRSVYIGGGTPSLFAARQLEALTNALRSSFELDEDFELCMEANPDESVLTQEKLRAVRRLGVTRLSMGAQSLDDELLRLNGRAGSSDGFRRVYGWAREAGFPVINIDFMCGLLGQEWEQWRAQVDGMLELAPDNIAIYKLELYMNTLLTRQLVSRSEIGRLIDDDEEARMARYAFARLQDEGGYQPVSCFSLIRRPEAEHVHTRGVWDGESLIGIGLSAYGTFGGFFYQNAWDLGEYRAFLENGVRPIVRAHEVTAAERIAATMVYGTKTFRLDRRRFVEKHGFDMRLLYGDAIDDLLRRGLLVEDGNCYRVPPDQYVFADDICRAFFLPEHRTMMRAHVPRWRSEEQDAPGAQPT